jgi:site-specific DNA-methyltransferase (cytosine-N4-specific)
VIKSDLPFGSEFSPSQIELPMLLEIAKEVGGDWKKFEGQVYDTYFKDYKTSEYNRRKLANNTKLGMIAYGIIERDASLTSFGQKLYDLRLKPDDLYRVLAHHILLNLHGTTLIQCIQDMQAAGETVDLIKLRHWLEERGIHFPRGGKHPSIMKRWLEKAGIFEPDSWRVNEKRLEEVLGTTIQELEKLAQFSPAQKAFLKALANMGSPGPHISSDIERLATATYGTKFDEKNLPKTVLYPLQEAGYITIERGTKAPGRGAKPFNVVATAKLEADLIVPILEQVESQVGSDIRPLLRKPLNDILQELNAVDKHVRGLALEALAFKLMRLIDLDYVATRLRGTATGGAEVDLIFESARLVFSRWQIQCKNVAGGVSLDDVAKEVGLTHMLKSNVVVIVSTGKIGIQARQYASKVMQDSNLDVVLIDGSDLEGIKDKPSHIVDVLYREARTAMKLKALEIHPET